MWGSASENAAGNIPYCVLKRTSDAHNIYI